MNMSRVYDTIPLYMLPKTQSLKNIDSEYNNYHSNGGGGNGNTTERFHNGCIWWFLQFYRILGDSKIVIEKPVNKQQQQQEETNNNVLPLPSFRMTVSEIWIAPRVDITTSRPIITATIPLTVTLQANQLQSYLNTFERSNYQMTYLELQKLHILLDLAQCELYTRDEWLSFVSLQWCPRNVAVRIDDPNKFKSSDYKLINEKIGAIVKRFKKPLSTQFTELVSLFIYWAIRSPTCKPCVPYTRDFHHSL